jgi:hypothetical protein
MIDQGTELLPNIGALPDTSTIEQRRAMLDKADPKPQQSTAIATDKPSADKPKLEAIKTADDLASNGIKPDIPAIINSGK